MFAASELRDKDGKWTRGGIGAVAAAIGGPLTQESYQQTKDALKMLGQESLGTNSLTTEEAVAVEKYIGEQFHTINSGLRKSSRMSQLVTHLDNAINKSPLSRPVVVYRGVGRSLSEKLEESWANSKSASFVDKAFVSTSASKQSATKFSKHMIEISVPAGTHALAIADKGEAELLFGRGHKFKVTSFTKTASGFRRIKAELVH
jgi:hypothetical protein